MARRGMVKITVYVPEELLRRAMKISGVGIAATIRLALAALVERKERAMKFEERVSSRP